MGSSPIVASSARAVALVHTRPMSGPRSTLRGTQSSSATAIVFGGTMRFTGTQIPVDSDVAANVFAVTSTMYNDSVMAKVEP